jgi:hypothetical protein
MPTKTPHWHRMTAFSVRCIRSTRPLAAGYWGIVLHRWVPHSFAGLCDSCDTIWRPWSVTMVYGQHKLDIKQEGRARDTISVMMAGRW